MKEFALIDILTKRFGTKGAGFSLGIGDDCAHLVPESGVTQLVTTDMSTNGVHFSDRFCTWENIGRRVVAVNLSDLAASGVDPSLPMILFLSVAVSGEITSDQLTSFIDGVDSCIKTYGASVAGGDTTAINGPFTVSVTAIGYSRNPVNRSGALPGDLLAVFGNIGMAGAGFEILDTGRPTTGLEELTRAYCCPTPLLKIGHELAKSSLVRGMLDLSDGIFQDAGHLARQSGCDLTLHIDKLPVHPKAISELGEEKAFRIGAGFGDDYALAAAITPKDLETAAAIAQKNNTPFTVVGEFQEGTGNVRGFLRGEPYSLRSGGYEHKLGK